MNEFLFILIYFLVVLCYLDNVRINSHYLWLLGYKFEQ